MTYPARPAPNTARAAAIAAFFLPLSVLPWLNPVAGGAMTPAIPLLVGWTCMALLFAGLPVPYASQRSFYAGLLLLGIAVIGFASNASWQMLAFGLLMMATAAVVAMRLVQDPALQPRTPLATAEHMHTGIALIAWSWLLAGFLNACIGLLQHFQHTAWLGGLINHAPVGQVYGNLRQRNQFATLMNMALWALWYLWQNGALLPASSALLKKTGRNGARILPATLAWVLMLPLAICTALTLSRGGMVQLAALMLMLACWTLRRKPADFAAFANNSALHNVTNSPAHASSHNTSATRAQILAWLAGLLLAYLATAYVLPHLYGGTDIALRLAGLDSHACISRTVLWGNVLHLVAQKPLTGWGWGELDFAHYSANYSQMRFCDMLDNAHNLPLHIAVELGVPIAVLACAAVLWWLLRQRPWAELAPARQLAWGVLDAIGIHSLLEYPLWYAPVQLACGLALGLLAATGNKHPCTNGTDSNSNDASCAQAPRHNPALRLAQRATAALLLLALAYASFDFVRVTQLYTVAQSRVWPFKQNTQAQAERSRLFHNAVLFAKLSTEPVTPQTAATQLAQAQKLMHYSPERRVAKRIIECLHALGRHNEAQAAQAHLDVVYPPKKSAQAAQDAEQEEAEED